MPRPPCRTISLRVPAASPSCVNAFSAHSQHSATSDAAIQKSLAVAASSTPSDYRRRMKTPSPRPLEDCRHPDDSAQGHQWRTEVRFPSRMVRIEHRQKSANGAPPCHVHRSRSVSQTRRPAPFPTTATAGWASDPSMATKDFETSPEMPSCDIRCGIARNSCCGFKRESCGKDREKPQQAPLRLGQQLIAPVQRCPQRLVSRQGRSSAAGEQ